MLLDRLSNLKKPFRFTRKTVDDFIDVIEHSLFRDRRVMDVPKRPESLAPRAWFKRCLKEVDLDWKTERKRGLFYYLDNALPNRPIDAYRPLRITFIQAGPVALEMNDGSKFIPEEIFGFIPSIKSSASSILGAIQADAAMNFNVEHIHLKARCDEFERLDESAIKEISEQNDIVLLGSQMTTWSRCREIISCLRAFNPSLILIAGGPQPTLDPDHVIDAGVDYAVRYDGCVSACGLIRAIAGGLTGLELFEYLREVPNLFYKTDSSGYCATPRMEIVPEGGAPYPPVLSTDFYSKQFREKIRILSTGASIGCPYKCAMCTSSRISSLSKRPVAHVIADIKRLYRMGELDLDSKEHLKYAKEFLAVILGQLSRALLGGNATQFFRRGIFFWDDNLTFAKNKEYAMELFEAMAAFYADENLIPPSIDLQVGIDFFEDEELVQAARKAGVQRVYCGFENISVDALKQMEKKKIRYDNLRTQYRDAVALAHKNGIAVHGYLMVGFNETPEDVETIATFFRDISVCTLQVLFVGAWRKKWVAKDIPDVARQPQFDLDLLNDDGRIPNYMYDKNGELIPSLITGGLVPTLRAENMDYQTLYNLRRKIYEEFYTFESVLDVIKNRNAYPDWVTTAVVRYQIYSKYLKILDQFYKIYDIEKKLAEADNAYQKSLKRGSTAARAMLSIDRNVTLAETIHR